MKLPISAAEADAIACCLACYLDNESDKNDGIGPDMMNALQEPLLFCANGDGDVLEVDWEVLLQINKALDYFQEDKAVDGQVVTALIHRIKSLLPQ